MLSAKELEQANVEGQARAGEIVERARKRSLSMAGKPFAGYLIAEGDSWYDYPLFEDTVEALEDDHNYDVRSAAHHGDTAMGIAYEPDQLKKVNDIFENLAKDGRKARAIIVSCAGNDVVAALGNLVNHRLANLGPLNASVVDGVIRQQVPAAVSHLLGALTSFSKEYFGEARPTLIHGYGNPVPDGRGYPVLGLSGPWLKPVFAQRGWVTADPQAPDELQANADVMRQLMKTYNEEVLPAVVAAAGPHCSYVDVRPALQSDLSGYQGSWRDELHATKPGFKAVAALINARIQQVAPTVP